jgi:WD40-like Beta Propeller Repeat
MRRTTILFAITLLFTFIGCKKKKEEAKNPPTPVKKTPKVVKKVVKPVVPKKKPVIKPKAVVKVATTKTVEVNKGEMNPLKTIKLTNLDSLNYLTIRDGLMFGLSRGSKLQGAAYDIKTGKELKLFPGAVHQPAFSADGKTLAVISAGFIDLLSWPSLTLVNKLQILKDEKLKGKEGDLTSFTSVAFSPDGKYIFTGEVFPGNFDGTYRQTLSIWDIKTLKRLKNHVEEISNGGGVDVSFASKGALGFGAVVGGDGKEGSFSLRFEMAPTNMVEQKKPFSLLSEVSFNLTGGDFIESRGVRGDYYIISEGVKLDGKLHVYLKSTGKPVKHLSWKKQLESDSTCQFGVSNDGKYLYFAKCKEEKGKKDSFGNDTIFYTPYAYELFSTVDFKPVATLKGRGFAFHPSSTHFVLYDKNLSFFKVGVWNKAISTQNIKTQPKLLKFSNTGDILAISGKNTVNLFKIK